MFLIKKLKQHIFLSIAIVFFLVSLLLSQIGIKDFYFKLFFYGSIFSGAIDFVLTTRRIKKNISGDKNKT